MTAPQQPDNKPNPAEIRDILAVLAKGAHGDITTVAKELHEVIAGLEPAAFDALPEDPTEAHRTIRLGASLLVELVYCSSFLATGLRALAYDRTDSAARMVNIGVDRLKHSGLIRHTITECPGHLPGHLPGHHEKQDQEDDPGEESTT